jgi:trk system potassium uptake protein
MKIIIIGCGRVGSGLAKMLGNRGHQVVVVDSDPIAFERLGKAFKGRTVIGIGFDRQALIDAGIERADALAAVTASDEANAVAARMAKNEFKVPRVAARIYDPRKAEIYRRLGLQTISPVALGITRMAELLSFSHMDVKEGIGTGEVSCIDVDIPALLVDHKASDLTIPGEIHVMAITRHGKTFLAQSQSLFEGSFTCLVG